MTELHELLEDFIGNVISKELSKHMSPKDNHITCRNIGLGAGKIDRRLNELDERESLDKALTKHMIEILDKEEDKQ